MLKVLIADDEIFTREGIIEQIPWDKIGVSEIRQAFDGIDALEIASEFAPDILLTDVRMPRMDGVQLSFKIRELFPSCEIIFMSGYSDKEYLKAAIKLKAVSYVEKPIDLDELQASLENAIASKIKSLENIRTIEKNLALELTSKDIKIENLMSSIDTGLINKLLDADFSTCLISLLGEYHFLKKDMLSSLEKIISQNGYGSISCFMDDTTIVTHLFWNKKKPGYSKVDNLNKLFSNLSEYIKGYSEYFIACGNKVSSINDLPLSYESSINAMNKAFYYYKNSIIFSSKTLNSLYKSDEQTLIQFSSCLSEENKQECLLLVKRLTSEIKKHMATPVNYVKDLYYRLFLNLASFASERSLGLSDNDLNSSIPFGKFLEFNTIYDAETYLLEKIETVFNYMNEKTAIHDNPVSNVLNYIHKNYDDIELSLQKISENTYLTTAYICTIFKNQTGMTVNKYILEYRLEKAKKLLKDRSMKINEIASKVGYSDGNYFTKIFRKDTGLTPSEYRQKYFS